MKHLLIIHPDLSVGGAERQLVHFLRYHDRKRFKITLLLYKLSGPLVDELEQIDIYKIVELRQRRVLRSLCRYVSSLKICIDQKPEIVFSYLVNTNLMGLFVGRLSGVRTVVWGIRVSKFSPSTFGIKGWIAHSLAILFSRYVDLVISNNKSGLSEYVRLGYRPRAIHVIPNGIDTERFQPNEGYRSSFRQEINANDHNIVICKIARVVSWKGYDIFLKAIEKLCKDYPQLVFVCVGSGDTNLLRQYQHYQAEHLATASLHWLGERNDVHKILSGSDIFTLATSEGEGFSNSLGEAMATSLPSVVTDVGDCVSVAGESALVVPPNDHRALAIAWQKLISDPKVARKMGGKARERVRRFYSVQGCVRSTEELLERIE